MTTALIETAGMAPAPVADCERVEEQPVFRFEKYGIAFHFLVPVEPTSDRYESMDDFWSFERDLQSHVYRDGGIFRSRVLRVPTELRHVELQLPPVLRYVAEGQEKELRVRAEDLDSSAPQPLRRRTLRLLASMTEFRSGVAVLHIVLNPDSRYPDRSALNEYDLVKIAKTWEGGERVGRGEAHDIQQVLGFAPSDSGGAPMSIQSLARRILEANEELSRRGRHSPATSRRHAKPLTEMLVPKAGTVQILVGPEQHAEVFAAIEGFVAPEGQSSPADGSANAVRLFPTDNRCAADDAPRSPTIDVAQKLKGVEGILCGLLDFPFVDNAELGDVFANPIGIQSNVFLDIHKGTLLDLCESCRVYEQAFPTIGISPYLLLPHSVMLHNEYWLQAALERADRVGDSDSEGRLREAELFLRAVLQRDYLPNLFHYPTERALYTDGHAARGLDDLRKSLEQRLLNLDGRLEEVSAKRESWVAFGFGVIGVLIATLQVAVGYEQLEQLWQDPVLRARWLLPTLEASLMIIFALFLYRIRK